MGNILELSFVQFANKNLCHESDQVNIENPMPHFITLDIVKSKSTVLRYSSKYLQPFSLAGHNPLGLLRPQPIDR